MAFNRFIWGNKSKNMKIKNNQITSEEVGVLDLEDFLDFKNTKPDGLVVNMWIKGPISTLPNGLTKKDIKILDQRTGQMLDVDIESVLFW